MRSSVTSNKCRASMISRPLFIIVALSTEILAPMFHFGCLTACSGVTVAMKARSRPRNGPPEAVSNSRRTPPGRLKSKHWKIAECSLSTGNNSAPPRLAKAVTSSPAQTRTSLLAKAMRAPRSIAAHTGGNPAAPTMPATTMSVGRRAASATASAPAVTSIPVPAKRSRNSPYRSGSAVTTSDGRSDRACSAASSTLRLTVKTSTRQRSGLRVTMSIVWVPIEPVDPRIVTLLRPSAVVMPVHIPWIA